ncbi:sensor histidine kinase [Xylophilus sp. GW821-FHT01B05]
MPTSLAPDHAPPARRLGIRTLLLALLLPGVTALLAIDSWSDYRAFSRTIENAYDQALLEPLSALDDSVNLDTQGEVDLTAPFAVEAMFESVQARHKHLRVGLMPLSPPGAPERILMGVSDLPPPPSGAVFSPPPATFGGPLGGHILFYDAIYRGYPLRVAALQRDIENAAGQRYRLQVQAAESTGRRIEARQAWLQRELWQNARMLGVTLLLVWLGVTWALRPLQRLRASLRERPAHELQPLDASGVPSEVAPLVDAVNHHIADHREVLAEQARFLADASHQLRTPLAIMLAQAGYALREQDPARMRETLHAIIAQLGRSRRLSDQLLALAHASRVQDAAGPPPLIDLNTVAREVVLQYLPLAREKQLDLGWVDVRGEDAPEGADAQALAAPVRAQAAELHEALANLLHNAIRHTAAGGSVTVALRLTVDAVVADIRDTGPGIAPERREAVFERFGRSTGGAGLGLAIARAYARRNGGDIVLAEGDASPDGHHGLSAQLQLPHAAGA